MTLIGTLRFSRTLGFYMDSTYGRFQCAPMESVWFTNKDLGKQAKFYITENDEAWCLDFQQ